MFNRVASIFLIILGLCIIAFSISFLIIPFTDISSFNTIFLLHIILDIIIFILGSCLGLYFVKKGRNLWKYLNINPDLSKLHSKSLDELTENEKEATLAVGLFKLILYLIIIAGIGYELWSIFYSSPSKRTASSVEWVERGNNFAKAKQYNQAVEAYTQAIGLDPDDYILYYKRGIAYFLSEEYQFAIEDFTLVIRLKPDYAEAYFKRGTTYFFLEEYQLAINDFTQAIKWKIDYDQIYKFRGRAYEELGKKMQAIYDYNQYLAMVGNTHGDAEAVRTLIIGLGGTPKY